MEPPNKGHFGTKCFILCIIEVVLFQEAQNVFPLGLGGTAGDKDTIKEMREWPVA
jgi:hypothetical protein